jgi:OFA family oxalate/formate antiporter-like MFS transporter
VVASQAAHHLVHVFMNPIARWLLGRRFYYGWVVTGAAGMAMFSGAPLAVSSISVFVIPISEEFGWTRTAFAGAISLASLVGAMVGPLMGRWTDKHGGRFLLGGGTAVVGFAMLGLSFVHNLVLFYLLLIIGRGMMMSVENLVGTTTVSKWFVRRRALANALAMLSSRAGLGLWPALAAFLFTIGDWRLAMQVIGTLVLVFSLVPMVLIVARRPEDLNLGLDGDAPVELMDDGTGASVVQAGEQEWTARQALRTRAFWLLTFASMATAVCGAGLGVHRIPYFIERGMDPVQAGPLLISFAAGMGVGGFAAAYLSTRISLRKVLALLMFLWMGLIVALLNIPINPIIFVYAFAEGMMLGGFLAMNPVIYALYFGRGSLGTIRGLSHPMVLGANAFGPIYAAVIYDATGQSYTIAFMSFGAFMGLSALLALFAKPPKPLRTAAAL